MVEGAPYLRESVWLRRNNRTQTPSAETERFTGLPASALKSKFKLSNARFFPASGSYFMSDEWPGKALAPGSISVFAKLAAVPASPMPVAMSFNLPV